MPPKKDNKKEVVEEPPKEEQPVIPQHELRGKGRFSYQNGAIYQGQWHLFEGVKLKHGQGTLILQSATASPVGKEMYEGGWMQDEMSGQGTYYYQDGATYKGKWSRGQPNGNGTYHFPNATMYEGEWLRGLMHGTGRLIDHTGKQWAGEFRKGIFESRRQLELLQEKEIALTKQKYNKQIQTTLTNFLEAVAKSDKKTLKENLSPFFATVDSAKELIKQPYAKFDERPPQKWTEIVHTLKSGESKVVESAEEATLLTADRILAPQLKGAGQWLELMGTGPDKVSKCGLMCLEQGRWVVIVVAEQERKKA